MLIRFIRFWVYRVSGLCRVPRVYVGLIGFM